MYQSSRFGSIEVSCEGYQYRDDPHVLKGSCGLRYTIDLTKEGHSYYGGGNSYYTKTSSQSSLANIIVFVAFGLMLWAFYKTCIANRVAREDAWSTTGDDYPAGGGGASYGWFGQGGGTHPTAPPPPGYHAGQDNASCRNRTSGMGSGTGSGTGGGGFWTGAIAGGLLGYMFGNNGERRHYNNYGSRYGGGGWNWGGGGGGSGHSFGGSSGTRGASGFGGTSRR